MPQASRQTTVKVMWWLPPGHWIVHREMSAIPLKKQQVKLEPLEPGRSTYTAQHAHDSQYNWAENTCSQALLRTQPVGNQGRTGVVVVNGEP